jgi:peroxiredoxin
MPAYNADLAKFAELDAQVVGISPDSIYVHRGWQAKDIGWMNYPLLSDFFPHAEVAEKYGVLYEGRPIPGIRGGISHRAVFVVDKEGRIAFSKVYDIGEQPPNEELFEALREIQAAHAGRF